MPAPRPLGLDLETNREIYLLSLDSVSDRDWTRCGRGQFVCFCAMDAREVSDTEIAGLCSHLLQLGCAYFCAWGPDCERVHDLMDQENISAHPMGDRGVLMTTWHANDDLQDALFFLLNCTDPDENYAPNGCDSALIVAIGRPDWSAAIDTFIGLALYERTETSQEPPLDDED